VTEISFAPDIKSLLRGAKTLLVVTPEKVLRTRKPLRLLGGKLDRLLVELGKDADVGDLGGTASTLTDRDPRRLVAGVVPERLSRYNSPSRADSIHRVVSAAGMGSKGRASILLVLDEQGHVEAAVNAVGRAFPQYSGKSGKPSTLRLKLLAVDRQGKPLEMTPLAESVMAVGRDTAALVDTPPTELNPAEFEARARAALKGIKHVKVRSIVGDKLLGEGLRGIHGVGRCATKAPRMVVASYEPPKTGKGKQLHVALVGKGVTYDTGGLHLKARGFMEGMKCDMGGAAAVLGAFRVLVENECRHRVTLILCMAENAIGPDSYKPDDILEMHSGKTVEINNTDAEGRLLLADGVSYATHTLGAEVVFDAATLTGAQLMSTGTVHAAVVTNDADLERHVIDAGRASGDLVHPLPFAPELYKQEFKSAVADMCNSVKNRMNAQTACAAQFVYSHMEDTRARWCHVDLAGPAFPKERGTGFGVAVLARAIFDLS
jgi:probable aminopeptidase NPEPL1